MSRSWRAFYGAALGALLVLLIHPASRPFLLTALSKRGSSKTFQNNPLILEGQTELKAPDSLVDAGLWMQEAALRIRQPQLLSARDLGSFRSVVNKAAETDADNAFWMQMTAVLTYANSKAPNLAPTVSAADRSMATSEWERASHLTKWDDYQTSRLETVQHELAKESGGSAAWQYAAVYPKRVNYCAEAIGELGRELVKNLDNSSPKALELRFATLMNGALMRKGARSIAIGEVGVKLVEIASFPKELSDISQDTSPRNLYLARTQFYSQLMASHKVDEAQQANEAFKSNDGWLAFLGQEDIDTQTRQLRMASLVTIDFPGALLGTAAIGGFLWLLATALKLKPALLKILDVPWGPSIGFVLAIIFYLVTQLAIASIAVFACFAFLAVTPNKDRTRAPEQMGFWFEITHFLLGCMLAAFMTAFLVGLSTPGYQVLQEMGWPQEYYGGSTLFLALAGTIVALLSFTAPCWAMVQRIATQSVVVISLRQFGRGLFLTCLGLAIIATPVCVIVDHLVQGRLTKVVANEPVYYLPQ